MTRRGPPGYHGCMATLAAGRRGLYRYAGDRVLDDYARHCGLPSGIGRLCLLDDRVLGKIVETVGIPPRSGVLDIGCGRGFLARWLLWNSLSCRYVGVGSATAVPAGGAKYERIFALESAPGVVSNSLARCIGQNLHAGGRYVITLASFDDAYAGNISQSCARLRRETASVRALDLTQQVREFASTLYSAILMGRWAMPAKAHVLDEAARALHAVESGAFNYTLLTGSV